MSVTLPTLRPALDANEPPRRRLSRRALLVGAAGIVVTAALLSWLVAFSSVFGVRTVSVRGLDTLSAARVRAVADVTRATPLVRLDTGAVARRVETIPEVASARVSTSFPNTVVVTVVERRPIGYLDVDGRAVLVDRTGDQYHVAPVAPRGLPKFVVPSGSQARATGEAVATVAATLPAALRVRVASIQAFDPTAITLVLTDQRVVRWGSADRSADKARILPALLTQPGTQFDVSNPDLVVAR